jgi:hypothetical protein
MKRNPPFRWEVSMAAKHAVSDVAPIVVGQPQTKIQELARNVAELWAEIVKLPNPEPTATEIAAFPFLNLDQLEKVCREQPTSYVVEGLLPANDIHVAVGDSGLGKTAWAYQLGLCVASGKPFLGMPVKKGRVLYFDMENGKEEILQVGKSLCTHLELKEFPKNFLIRGDEGMPLAKAAACYQPALILIDTLRPFQPNAEKANDEMGKFLQELKTVARREHSAIVLLHHIRKPGELGVPALEETPTLEWLQQASGARALINQTNTRIAFDRARRNQAEKAAFVMKAFVKMKGETESIFIERVLDDQGQPVGYRRVVGVGLLGNPDQEAAYARLPENFTFKEAIAIYNRTPDPTNKWLKKCEAAGLLEKLDGRGPYRKLRVG